MFRSLLCLIAMVLSGCMTTGERDFQHDRDITIQMRSMMLGQWCGEKVHTDGTHQRWIVDRFVDGTYQIMFTVIRPGEAVDQWGEYGLWGIRHPKY